MKEAPLSPEAIRIDFEQDPRYGHDQADVSYSTVLPTVTFALRATPELIRWAERQTGKGSDCAFSVGINGYTKTRVSSWILMKTEEEAIELALSEAEQQAVYAALDEQCRDTLQVGCDELL